MKLKPETVEQIKVLLKARQKPKALKLVIEETGLGLKAGKDLVDAIEQELRKSN